MGERKTDAPGGKRDAKIGILTFHCADNYGALLQAYGLLTWLRTHAFDAEIVPYAPFYMTRRHWLIQLPSFKRGEDPLRSIRRSLSRTLRNLRMLPELLEQKKRMRAFRRKALGVSGLPMIWTWQLRFTKYCRYIIGSDQIWNPAITFGLRRAYFGAIPGKRKKVVAYAASLGAAELPPEYREEFARLVRQVDIISVREEDSAAFVEKASGKKVCVMPDPVMLLGREQWERVKAPCPLPDGFRYVLYHATQANKEMEAYAEKLAAAKGIEVLQVCYRKSEHVKGFRHVFTAGPCEFLAYIDGAEYVVSNSFHAVAMSIRFRKPFTAFLHSASGARVRGLLKLCGLTDRLYRSDAGGDADRPIAWETAEENIARAVERAEDFLYASLREGDAKYE